MNNLPHDCDSNACITFSVFPIAGVSNRLNCKRLRKGKGIPGKAGPDILGRATAHLDSCRILMGRHA